jgi:Flp pilus assembly protein TadD
MRKEKGPVVTVRKTVAIPRNRDAELRRALRVRRTKGPAAALQLFQKLVREHPRDAELRFQLAQTLDNLGRERQAIPHYHRALRLDPKHAHVYESYLYLASSYRNVGRPRAARTYLKRAIAMGRGSRLEKKLGRLLMSDPAGG